MIAPRQASSNEPRRTAVEKRIIAQIYIQPELSHINCVHELGNQIINKQFQARSRCDSPLHSGLTSSHSDELQAHRHAGHGFLTMLIHTLQAEAHSV